MVSINARAENVVDIYGVGGKKAERILKKYSKKIAEVQSEYLKEILESIKTQKKDKSIEIIRAKRTDLVEKIKKEGDFLFVNFQTISYSHTKDVFTTIEVIKNSQSDRLRFISTGIRNESKPKTANHQVDLIDQMIAFEDIEVQLKVNNQLSLEKASCPVYHCLTGFNHPKLKPYLEIFNRGVIKEKKLIVDTLEKDKNPERRTAAAYLVGHFAFPKEIISLLSQHVDDSDPSVRNSVMRVIGETMEKAKITQINVMPFLRLLDSPYTTDRNKALFVLFNAVDSYPSKKIILRQGKAKLLALLRLKQPNNHRITYLILKKISGKDFGENNVRAWEKWLSAAQS